MAYTNINGKIVNQEDANIHIFDLGLLRGVGIFDYFLVENNIPVFFDLHMIRFENSLKGMGFEVDVPQIKKEIIEIIEKNNFIDSSLKVIVTGGYSDDEFTLSKCNYIIINKKLKFSKTSLHDDGARLITCEYQRELSHVKTTNYLQAVRMQPAMKADNAVEVLYLNDSYVRECSRSNIFMVKDHKILTPKTNILNGINRQQVLLNFSNAEENDFTYEDLLKADEVFITSTTKRVLPIVSIDGHLIGNGKVGSISKSVMDLLIK